ncbi:hypothetical protein SAMN04488136_12942 [Vibrio xiamenensis]|uniref:Uncharacterized protein n=1 Tax=Vibrio xiamenensis TaxID=861298 RepID=A0A1G8F9R0_9VIBR|nr:hypothetical protein [Vibrio xiamenensis]SDH78832.1 hypothetical protein SAMN04488136_12942 [Vibrio xiamenensis]
MMYANLVDLEDFSAKLIELGVEVAPRADFEQVQQALSCWLQKASSEQLTAFDRANRELADNAEVLPQVAQLMARR